MTAFQANAQRAIDAAEAQLVPLDRYATTFGTGAAELNEARHWLAKLRLKWGKQPGQVTKAMRPEWRGD